MIYLDAHVHIQASFNVDRFLLAALANFDRQKEITAPHSPGTYCLLLTEAKAQDYFSDIKQQALHRAGPLPRSWRLQATAEAESVLLAHPSTSPGRLFVIAGRQLVTRERLEVLALACPAKIDDGAPLRDTVDAVRRAGGLAVLPWGVGKWLGKRGEILSGFLRSASPESLFVGDNGGRPWFWPRPVPFDLASDQGIRLLPGSDPLPLPGEEGRVGTYGARIDGDCSDDTPAADLKSLLRDGRQAIIPYGQRQGTWRFVRTQIGLRVAK